MARKGSLSNGKLTTGAKIRILAPYLFEQLLLLSQYGQVFKEPLCLPVFFPLQGHVPAGIRLALSSNP
jgi:hypothetical protein